MVEIFSKSGKSVSCNLEGRSLKSATKSSSSSWSAQLGLVWILFGFVFFSVSGFLDSISFRVLSNWVLDCFVDMGFDVLFLVEFGLSRSKVFLARFELGLVEFEAFEVELSFLSLILMVGMVSLAESILGFRSLVLFLVDADVRLISFVWFFAKPDVVFNKLVWFLAEFVVVLMDLVWFLVVGLMSLDWFLVAAVSFFLIG